ncbi:hypothetical protein C7431_101392 [Pantoea allii]|uniref:Uncharacterized protein n=1 Tax=Pantoea allii TaxID=574096 RepID=A0A2V2BMQ4_9GAMM|nr:hypothetical protein C7431_101392 [Pantoea allii]
MDWRFLSPLTPAFLFPFTLSSNAFYALSIAAYFRFALRIISVA